MIANLWHTWRADFRCVLTPLIFTCTKISMLVLFSLCQVAAHSDCLRLTLISNECLVAKAGARACGYLEHAEPRGAGPGLSGFDSPPSLLPLGPALQCSLSESHSPSLPLSPFSLSSSSRLSSPPAD